MIVKSDLTSQKTVQNFSSYQPHVSNNFFLLFVSPDHLKISFNKLKKSANQRIFLMDDCSTGAGHIVLITNITYIVYQKSHYSSGINNKLTIYGNF